MGIHAKSYRFDDDVRREIAKLRSVYGTDNAGMRFAFGLAGTAEVKRTERAEGQVPSVVLKKMPADLGADSVITSLNAKGIEYTSAGFRREPRQKGDKGR